MFKTYFYCFYKKKVKLDEKKVKLDEKIIEFEIENMNVFVTEHNTD